MDSARLFRSFIFGIYFISLIDISATQLPSNQQVDQDCNQYAYTSKIRFCLEDKPCKNPAPCGVPRAECRYRRNRCNTCDEKWYVDGREVQCVNKYRYAECPQGTRRNNTCNACEVVNCPDSSYIHKICRLYACNDVCKAEFYVNNRWQSCPDGIYPDRPMVEALGGNENAVGVNQMFDSEVSGAFVPNFGTRESIASSFGNSQRVGDVASARSVCPAGVREFQCANLCLDSTCPEYEDATCIVNNCGGCRAEYYLNNQRVDCNAKRCDGAPRNQICNACRNAYCHRYPQATCRMNNCYGRCKAEYFVNNHEVKCNELNLIDSCQNGQRRQMCHPNLCRSYLCPKDKDIICWIDNCGKCKAVFSRKGTRQPTECPGWWSMYEQNSTRPATDAEVRAAWDRHNLLFGSVNVPQEVGSSSIMNEFNQVPGTNPRSMQNDMNDFQLDSSRGFNFNPSGPEQLGTVDSLSTSEGRVGFNGASVDAGPLVRDQFNVPSIANQANANFGLGKDTVNLPNNAFANTAWGDLVNGLTTNDNSFDQFQPDTLQSSMSNQDPSSVDLFNAEQNGPLVNSLFFNFAEGLVQNNPILQPPSSSQKQQPVASRPSNPSSFRATDIDSLILQLEDAISNDIPNFDSMAHRTEPNVQNSIEPKRGSHSPPPEATNNKRNSASSSPQNGRGQISNQDGGEVQKAPVRNLPPIAAERNPTKSNHQRGKSMSNTNKNTSKRLPEQDALQAPVVPKSKQDKQSTKTLKQQQHQNENFPQQKAKPKNGSNEPRKENGKQSSDPIQSDSSASSFFLPLTKLFQSFGRLVSNVPVSDSKGGGVAINMDNLR